MAPDNVAIALGRMAQAVAGEAHHPDAHRRVRSRRQSTIQDTTIPELKADKYQASVGARSMRGRLV
jgi:hypothetical protein